MPEKPIYVVGLTALNLAGLTHFLSTRAGMRVQLYSEHPLPGRIDEIPVAAQFERHETLTL
jgi:hypothetical protein